MEWGDKEDMERLEDWNKNGNLDIEGNGTHGRREPKRYPTQST